jgi:hypothetical protein
VFTYPKQLRNKCISYFKQRCDFDIDHETADIYLDNFADFYEAMENIVKNSTSNFNSKDIRFLGQPDRVEQKTDTFKN